jgi:hypothetical protein
VLLVDDDSGLNVRSYYTAALDLIGVGYDAWTVNGALAQPELMLVEPNTATLALYDAVIWFSGDAGLGVAGPDANSETALGQYLDAGGCFLLSSQNYVQSANTSFLNNHLGVASYNLNANYTSVTGVGAYGLIGPQPLTFPGVNSGDRLFAGAEAQAVFDYATGTAGVSKAGANGFSTFWAFPAEALSTTARAAGIYQFLSACGVAATSPLKTVYLPLVSR